jgi:AcrR family transcriptional regulator
MPREDVARSQRERLFAAAVASIAAKGYEATTVADLLELSGVSRSAFYEHFRDKEDCVLATFDALVAMSVALVRSELAKDGPLPSRAGNAVEVLFETIVRQEAAARLCFCDIYAVGERGRLAVEQAIAKAAQMVGETIAQIRGEELPASIVLGLVGGTQIVVQTHLRRGEAELLPGHAKDIQEIALRYERPSAPLRVAGRRPRPTGGRPPFVAYSQAERIIRALAAAAGERGYPAVTVAEIAARASISQATFYSHFADKHAALVAAIDSAGAQMLGVAMPAARRAPNWSNAIRAAVGGLCAFYASEPDMARLASVEVYAAGPVALEHRDRRFEAFLALIEPGFSVAPETKPIAADLALGAVWTLVYNQIVTGGPEGLLQIAPLASYMILAPFAGTDEAVRISNGDGRLGDH